MAMSVEHWSKFAALHQQWWRLNMSEKISVGRKPQTNKTRLKNSRVGWKTTNKQNRIEKILECDEKPPNKQTNKQEIPRR